MAGAVRHMERSHRSHKTSPNTFLPFVRYAYTVKNAKVARETFGQKLAKGLNPLKEAVKQAVDK